MTFVIKPMIADSKVNIKLVRGEEIRLLHKIPSSWNEFQETLRTMYGSSDFHITYIDDESDHITIATEIDFLEGLNFASGRPSLKLYLKPQSLAQDFEELKIDEKPVIENFPVVNPEQQNFFWRGRGRWGGPHRGGFCRGMKKMKKFMKHAKNKMIKMKVVYKNFPKKWFLKVGSVVVITWTVINKGHLPWPEGSFIMDLEGEIKLFENVSLSEVKPGEIINCSICVTVPNNPGKYQGRWALMVGQECAGVLKSKIIAIPE
jgi:hypothetical protein